MTEQEEKELSLSAWRLNIKRYGKPQWLKMYKHFLGVPVSLPSRFYKSLNMYGEWAMFEAIIATSQAQITGDPLNYCLKVCHSKWIEMQKDEESEDKLKEEIESIKSLSHKQNEELARKLSKLQGGKKREKVTKLGDT